MKYFVPIDQSTIKTNPRAGEESMLVKGPREISFVIKGEVPDYVKKNEFIIVISERFDGAETSGIILKPDIEDQLLQDENLNIEIKVDNNIERIYHAKEPQYLYQYENIEIECDNCHSIFKRRELKSDAFPDGEGGEFYSDKICPKCGEMECCELEYEKIDDVLTK